MSNNEKSDTYKAGLAMRRKVLGDTYVDEALKKVTDFNQPLQDYLTEHAWGAVWVREGLEPKTRSMLNLAILTAINRPHELNIHLRGAIRNGVTRDEVREIFLHCAAYCGAPAAVDSFKLAAKVFEEMDAEQARQGSQQQQQQQ